ncbi:hypothetical protein JTB14_007249 [Gonioctena quinquepunctata]|nr:hypothetical protein JTB14_007249 [Gonioctena quinquepunctata]
MVSALDILIFLCLVGTLNALQCMDENNNPVDWYVLYKIPKLKHVNKLIKYGVAYTYMTSGEYHSWKVSENAINSSNSIIGNTLQTLFDNSIDLSYILYNDEPPEGATNSVKGHTKGVVMADLTGGFWLVHSVPKFPVIGTAYTYPSTGITYGQSFLCISMDLKNLNSVGVQLQYNQPNIYGAHILPSLESSSPDLAKAAANVTKTTAPWYHVMNIYSKNGVEFMSFAKSKSFNKDLYEDLVAPSLESDLLVETWPNGPGRLQSDCTTKFKVNNVGSIFIDAMNASFKNTHDHSKWSVSSTSSEVYWTCIGDINRAAHQELRGGGTVCLKDKLLAAKYQKIVATVEECQKFETNNIEYNIFPR